jgi:AraC family transcriptional regulator, transcriptional activator of pobA
MKEIESLEEFYKRKFDWMPDNLRNEIGHFNVFLHEPIEIGKAKSIPYKRRDFYKIMLVVGDIKINYADQVIQVKKQALSFSNPLIPYTCENLDRIQTGVYCIFNQHFVHQFTNLTQYSVFQPKGEHVFELTDEQTIQISAIYKRMFEEINSDYVHKYDMLRNLVFELLHFAMKMQPSSKLDKQPINASQRITTLFSELLERQFPIDDSHQKITLRTASDFALQLNVHSNHLNRAVKEITKKTTTQLIAERILQESKVLLKYSSWPVADIAFGLGFTETTHFNNFFKKHLECSPLQFRKK